MVFNYKIADYLKPKKEQVFLQCWHGTPLKRLGCDLTHFDNQLNTSKEMKKRWIALNVENTVGVLSKVSGLFSGKAYNLQSLTVGETEDETVSRMTISVMRDDVTFEQIKTFFDDAELKKILENCGDREMVENIKY